jgi:hypothetical protein
VKKFKLCILPLLKHHFAYKVIGLFHWPEGGSFSCFRCTQKNGKGTTTKKLTCGIFFASVISEQHLESLDILELQVFLST